MTTPNDPTPRPATRKSVLEKEVRSLKKQRTELDVQLSPLQSEREEIKSELRRKEEGLVQLEARLSPLQSKREKIERELSSREEELVGFRPIPTDPASRNDDARAPWIEFGGHPSDEEYVRDSPAYWRSLTGYGRAFEKAVGELFRDLGYSATVTQPSGDGGVDVRHEKDGETTLIQCKAERHRVSRGVLKAILEVGEARLADHVTVASTTGFADKAKRYAADYVIDLYGPEELAELGARAKENLYRDVGNLVIESMNAPSCPDCGKMMLERRPHHSVQPFWGCSDYPRCTGIRSIED